MIERCARAGYLPSLMALRGGPERVEIPLRIPTDSVHNSDLHAPILVSILVSVATLRNRLKAYGLRAIVTSYSAIQKNPRKIQMRLAPRVFGVG